MQIGFDAKKIVANLTGIGNYSRGVVTMLSGCFPENKYLLFAPGKGREECTSRLRPSPNVSFVYSPHSSSLLREWWRCRGMVKDIRRAGIDLFHGLSNELPFGIRKAGCKSVVTIHDLIFLRLPETYGFLARAILKAKTRYACRHADRIIAISRQTKQDIMAFYGIPEEKISIVYQGCDRIFYRQVSDDELHDVQVKYALPSRYLLCVGTFEPRKNQLTALRALAQLDADDIRLVLVSKRTAYQAVLEKEIADLGLQQREHVLNDVPNGDLPAAAMLSFTFPASRDSAYRCWKLWCPARRSLRRPVHAWKRREVRTRSIALLTTIIAWRNTSGICMTIPTGVRKSSKRADAMPDASTRNVWRMTCRLFIKR